MLVNNLSLRKHQILYHRNRKMDIQRMNTLVGSLMSFMNNLCSDHKKLITCRTIIFKR